MQKAGIIQFFDLIYELAWKFMKNCLESQGFTDVKSPRAAIKKSFETGILTNGQASMELSNLNLRENTGKSTLLGVRTIYLSCSNSDQLIHSQFIENIFT